MRARDAEHYMSPSESIADGDSLSPDITAQEFELSNVEGRTNVDV